MKVNDMSYWRMYTSVIMIHALMYELLCSEQQVMLVLIMVYRKGEKHPGSGPKVNGVYFGLRHSFHSSFLEIC